MNSSSSDKEATRRRIIRRLRKMRRETSQLIRDLEWWNENRVDAQPFDVGWDKVLIGLIDKQLDEWVKREPDRQLTTQLAKQMTEHVESRS